VPVGKTSVRQAGFVGQNLGLPQHGRGSVAAWRSRITALVLDWALSMLLAVAVFGTEVLTGHGWRSFMVLAVFFVETATLSMLAGGSFGQLITRITVARLDGKPLGPARGVPRALLVCLVIPALVVDENRRGLHDLVLGTAVLNRR